MKVLKFLKSYGFFIVVLIISIVFMLNFSTATVNGSSMFPNFENGDLLLVLRTDNVDYGDVVVIWNSTLGKKLCKRVIGKAGDSIEIVEGVLYRNDKIVQEPYVDSSLKYSFSKVTVPTGAIFVLGDNRCASTDSRALGSLPLSDLYGKSLFNFTKTLHITYKEISFILAICWVFVIVNLFISRAKVVEPKVETEQNEVSEVKNETDISDESIEDSVAKNDNLEN